MVWDRDVPFTYLIDPSLGLVRLTSGETLPTVPDLEQALDRLLADPQFRPGFGVLVERRQLHVAPDSSYVRGGIEALAVRRERFGHTRFASLTGHLTSFGMGRMGEAYADNRGVPYRVFRNEEEALLWLLAPTK